MIVSSFTGTKVLVHSIVENLPATIDKLEQFRRSFVDDQVMQKLKQYRPMGKARKNCIIGQTFCLHHITGTAFIIRLTFYVYIVGNSETFQKIYSFIQFK